jgi:hypothetical protein
MTEAQIQALGPMLADFLDRFLFWGADTRTFAHLSTYCRGLLSDLPRKSAEPIALAALEPAPSPKATPPGEFGYDISPQRQGETTQKFDVSPGQQARAVHALGTALSRAAGKRH